jgi:hypothetical protein
MVRAIFNREIKPPVTVHPSLPNSGSLVELLGAQRRMAKILSEEDKLFEESPANGGRRAFE